MRIAITGTHGIGKTTLIEDFVEAHPGYEAVPEPYWDPALAGVALARDPTMDDMATQLTHSVRTIIASKAEANVVFDRCPIDFIAYLEVMHEEVGGEWMPSGRELKGIEDALAALDLIVFLPVSTPDEIITPIERPGLRRRVDERIKLILRDDSLGLAEQTPTILEITGPRNVRKARLDAALC